MTDFAAALRAERDGLQQWAENCRQSAKKCLAHAEKQEARAEAAEAKVEKLTVVSKALASWCVSNIQPNLEMDTLLHALSATATTEEGK